MYAESVLQRQIGTMQAATGIVVGRKEKSAQTTKYIIYDIIVTPLPEETGASQQKGTGRPKNLIDLLNLNYTKDGFKYSDWVAEFHLTVSLYPQNIIDFQTGSKNAELRT